MRFPHGSLPADLLADYHLDDFLAFTSHPDFDILDIHFGEMEGPDEWIEYELSGLIAIRDELMAGDRRALYIVWLAAQRMMVNYAEAEKDDLSVPPVPPGMGAPTSAQLALAELLQVPEEMLAAAAHHSQVAAPPTPDDEVAQWLPLLPADRREDYLLRLARNEPGLSRALVQELRAIGQAPAIATQPSGELVPYATLLPESQAVRAQLVREKQIQAQLARQQHLQEVRAHMDEYWRQVEMAVSRGSGTGYDEAVQTLIELRSAANQFNESQQFHALFLVWVQPHLRRPAFVKRLQAHKFKLPEGEAQ